MNITLEFNTERQKNIIAIYDKIFEIANNIIPAKKPKLVFEKLPVTNLGRYTSNDDLTLNEISIDTNLSLNGTKDVIVATLCHEIAHVISKPVDDMVRILGLNQEMSEIMSARYITPLLVKIVELSGVLDNS